MAAKTRRRRVSSLALAYALACAVIFLSQASADSDPPTDYDRFDHFATGFPLVGGHAATPCESCHAAGRFQGLPRDCAACHTGTGGLATTRKPPNHVPSSARCGDCHIVVAWSQARFDHSAVGQACGSCHNGSFAGAKYPGHLPTSNRCGDCHFSTATWTSSRFDHVGISNGCLTCHNGTRATGKHPAHIPAPNTCELCHNTISWR